MEIVTAHLVLHTDKYIPDRIVVSTSAPVQWDPKPLTHA